MGKSKNQLLAEDGETLTQKAEMTKRMYIVANIKNLQPTISNVAIAAKLGVSESTIRCDIARLNEIGMEWGNKMAQGGFMFSCQANVARLELVLQDWETRIKDNLKRGKRNDTLMTKFANLVVLETQMIDNIPMYHKFSYYARLIEEGKVTPQMLKPLTTPRTDMGVSAQLS